MYKVEPSKAVRARNLLANDRNISGFGVLDEVEERGPKVPLIRHPASFACRAERLAGTRTCPQGTGIGPIGKAGSVGPATDPSKEMALGVPNKIDGVHIFDASFIHISVCDQARSDQVAQPCGGERIVFVIVSPWRGCHDAPEFIANFHFCPLKSSPGLNCSDAVGVDGIQSV